MNNSHKEAAIKYGQQGYPVFPVVEGGKKPLVKGWQKSATSDAAKIEEIWSKYPKANIGILTGWLGDLVVVDVDVKGEVNGFDSLGEAISEELKSSSAPKVKTPSGGMHLYYRYTAKLPNNKVGILDGVDIRSDGGYIVAPPSVTDEGEYKWI